MIQSQLSSIQPITNSLIEAKEVYYIDISTRNINTTTGVVGTNSNFTLQNMNLELNPNKKYSVNIETFIYENLQLAQNCFPLLLSDIAADIIVNNTKSSILYRSNTALTANSVYIICDSTNNSTMHLPLKSNSINNMHFEIVRSDTGKNLALNPTSTVTILLRIAEV